MRAIPAVIVVCLAGLSLGAQQRPPLIQSRITIVPIDVRVLDGDGRPVTDLTQDDFVVLEDAVPQPIKLFASHTFTPDPSAAAAPPDLRRASGDTSTAVNRRVFLLMAGRGRHQVVSKYVDEMAAFVSNLLPQDLVAFTAWNRATDFTADRAKMRAVIQAYRDRHEEIEADLRSWFSGLRAVYGSTEIPARIQQKIDAVFGAAPALRPRSVAPSSDADARSQSTRRNAAEIQRDAIIKERPPDDALPDLTAAITAELGGMTFEEYIGRASETYQALGRLYSAIEYLRYLDGEKHVVLLTERGVYMPLIGGNNRLARLASDARIALNFIQTGGVVGAPLPRTVQTAGRVQVITSPVPSFASVASQTFSIQDLREVAEGTGGRVAAFSHAAQSFSRIGEGLGSYYVLGYAPLKEASDGRYRRVEVKVKRPGLDVHHRRGYFASPQIVPLDRREFVTFSRIRAAAQYTRSIDDIGVRVAGVSLDPGMLHVQLRVDLRQIPFTAADGVQAADLDVALYATDHDRNVVGEIVQRVDLRFSPELYARALKEGAVIALRVPLKGPAADLKAVVYDYRSDRLGTVQGNLR